MEEQECYLIINGNELNGNINLTNEAYLYGTLTISKDGEANFDSCLNDNFSHAPLITIRKAMKLISDKCIKKINKNDYWKALWPSLKLFINNNKIASKQINNKLNDIEKDEEMLL